MRRVIKAVVLSLTAGGFLLVGAVSAPNSAQAAASDLGGITGTVMDPAGHPVPGVDVQAVVTLTNVVMAHTTTNAAGAFTFSGLRSQNYDLKTRAAVYAEVNRNLDISTAANGTTVAVLPGRTSSARIGLVKPGRLTGTVTDSGHRALAGVQVTAEMGTPGQASDPAFEYRTITDSQGRYEIDGMEPTVTSVGTHQGYQVSFFRNGLSILTVTQTVAADATGVLNATLVAGGPVSLSGTVRNPSAQPVPGVAVTLSTEGFNVLSNGFGGFDTASVVTDANGRYTFNGLDNDEHWVLVSSPSFATYRSAIAGGSDTFNIGLQPRSTVSGVVRDANGTPVWGALVSPSGSPRGGVPFALTDSTGHFQLEWVGQGGGVVVAYPFAATYYGLGHHAPSGGSGPSFTVGVGESKTLADIVVQPGARVRGRVVNQAGIPVAGALVTDDLVLGSTWDSPSTYTHVDGTFELAGVQPGSGLRPSVSAPGCLSYAYPHFSPSVDFASAQDNGLSSLTADIALTAASGQTCGSTPGGATSGGGGGSGGGPTSAPPEVLGTETTPGGGFTGIAAVRVFDSRNSTAICGAKTISLEGVAGLSAAQMGAVALNVTITAPTAAGFAVVWATGAPRPRTSTVNFVAGQTVANAALVELGTNASIDVAVSVGCAQVVIDVVGSFANGTAGAGGYQAAAPQRLVDTRNGGGPLCAAKPMKLTIPGTSAGESVVLNLTAVTAGAPGYLSVAPFGAAGLGASSSLNFVALQTAANMVVSKVDDSGAVAIANSNGCSHIVVDLLGMFVGGTPASGGFTGVTPTRLADSRTGGGPLCGSQSLHLALAGHGGVPSSGAGSVVLNLTVDAPSAPGYLSVHPGGSPGSATSSLNFSAAQTVANIVFAKLGPDGSVEITNAGGCAHAIVDVLGWFSG